jgi:predicted ATPase
VAGLIRAVSVNSQVIVATQSPTFLNHFEPEEVVTVESHQGQSTFRRLDAEQLQGWLAEYSIGDLWQRNVVGAGPLP